LAFGVFLWWRTQRRIERTRSAISTQVKAAIGDINGRVDRGMGGVEERFGAALEAQKVAFSAITVPTGDEIASEVESAVNDALGAFRDELGPMMSTHVYQAVQQVKAQETKALQAQLEELGVGAVVDEAKGMLAEQLPPQMLQAQRILGMKVSKKYAAEHPIEAQALEMGKLYLMQMMQGQLGIAPGAAATQSIAPATRGFGVR
jgi:hypothetical protein